MDKEQIKKTRLEVLNFRHACKIFDKDKKIPPEDLEFLLECARLAPSSFGLEQTKITIVTNDKIRESIKPFAWNQEQITSSSHLLILKTRISELDGTTEYVKKSFSRKIKNDNKSQEAMEARLKVYNTYLDKLEDRNIFWWGSTQAHIVAENIVESAAYIGIDSCMIAGFEKENIESLLKVDTKNEQISLMIALGYRVKEQSKKLRLDMSEIVDYIK